MSHPILRRTRVSSTLLLAFLLPGYVVSKAECQAKLLADINTQPSTSSTGSNPTDFVSFRGALLFTALDLTSGRRIWRTDGTKAGTAPIFGLPLRELFQLQLSYTAQTKNAVIFRALTATSGAELWRTDGTTAGTYLLKDIVPGGGSSMPQNFVSVGTTVYFTANTAATGVELWRTDGTKAGTVLVADINPGPASSRPFWGTPLGKELVFAATGPTGYELWKTDGTSAGTTRLKDINPGSAGSYPQFLTPVGKGTLVFAASGPANRELWRTDGTAAGTVRLRDINPGKNGSAPFGLIASGGKVYFAADDGSTGTELWRTDGTTAGTQLVKDIVTGATGSKPRKLAAFSGGVLFTADANGVGRPWFSNGTSAGTTMLSSSAFDGSVFTAVPGASPYAVFRANGPSGIELWRTQGTPASTRLAKDIRPGPMSAIHNYNNYFFGVVGAAVVFGANDGKLGEELWRSDGTAAGTQLLQDLQSTAASSRPRPIGEINGIHVFAATDGVRGAELWSTDGTAANTKRLPLPAGAPNGSGQQGTALGRYLYFVNVPWGELWRTDGTGQGTSRIARTATSFRSTQLVRVGNRLFFGSGAQLWVSDGSVAGTKIVATFTIRPLFGVGPVELTAFRNKIWFVTEDKGVRSLWSSDGTKAGTVRFATPGNDPTGLAAAGSRLYFSNSEARTGTELWSTDGTIAGTTIARDIAAGTFGSYPRSITGLGDKVYFVAGSDAELWVSNGTSAGTFQVRDINPTGPSRPENLTPFGNRLLFSAITPGQGREPWISDGTAKGTVLLRDIAPGPLGSMEKTLEGRFVVVGSGRLAMFSADDGKIGAEPWRTDGTAAGTALAADVGLAQISTRPSGFAMAGRTVVFAANDKLHGEELFGIRLVDLRDSIAKPIGVGCAGSTGKTPTLRPIGLPSVGNAKFALELRDAAANAPAVLAIGIRFDIVAFSPNCASLNPAALIYLPLRTSAAGTARINLPIPASPSIRGLPPVVDVLTLDAGGALLNIGSVTNALLMLVGD